MCGEKYSFRIIAEDIWECVACNKSGDLDSLKEIMKDDLFVKIEDVQKPEPPEGLIVVGEYRRRKDVKLYSSGINLLDRMLGGLAEGELTIMTGKRGEGKSTLSGQIALNLVNDDIPICYYSGELNKDAFQDWIVTQACSHSFLEQYVDKFGEVRYRADEYSEPRILSWLGKYMIMYDGSAIKNISKEHNTIIDRFDIARKHYGCKFFFVDNLKTAKFSTDSDKDYYRAQANFVRDLLAFAIANSAHVVLVAHPRKNDEGDANDNVAGSSDIPDLASNVLRVAKTNEKERAKLDCDSLIEVTKGRKWGDTGAIRCNFDKPNRRFISLDGTQINTYGWEG